MTINFKKGILISVILVLWMTGIANAQPSAEEFPPHLFSAVSDQNRSDNHLGPEVLRWRNVEIDFRLLQEAGRSESRPGTSPQPEFAFNLFDDATYLATIETRQELSNESIGMTGILNSDQPNEFVLVLRHETLQAYLQDGPRYYEVRSNGAGTIVVEVDPEQYPESLEPEILLPGTSGQTAADDRSSTEQPQADPADQIDVLAVYTPAARSAVGGTAAMQTRIEASILSTNQGYSASGVLQQVRLVGMEEVSYTETVPGVTDPYETWLYGLYRLTFGRYGNDPADANYLAEARAFRDSLGADLVFMVTALPNSYCGLGWLGGDPGDANIGYSVVRYNCTGATSYTVQHEMGHNMGACHDRANNSSSGCYDLDYSYGYQQPDEFYTVMAYSNGCGSCTRLNRWSNPNLTYNGFPTGIPLNQPNSAYNTLTLNSTAINVANYRQSANPISANFVTPSSGGTAMIPRTILEAAATSTVGSIVRVTFSAHYNNSWHTLYSDTNGSDGWSYLWPTYNLTEQMIDVRAEIEDSLGNIEVIQLPDIGLSRSHTIGGIYSSREGNIQTEESFEAPRPAADVVETAPESSQIPAPRKHYAALFPLLKFLLH